MAHAAPLLLVHGEEDHAIPIDQSEELLAAYTRVGALAELVRVPGTGHFFDDADRDRLTGLGIDFLRRWLSVTSAMMHT
jgi:dipeptidyl aminopeptidase/acylaminoacyl peptidase